MSLIQVGNFLPQWHGLRLLQPLIMGEATSENTRCGCHFIGWDWHHYCMEGGERGTCHGTGPWLVTWGFGGGVGQVAGEEMEEMEDDLVDIGRGSAPPLSQTQTQTVTTQQAGLGHSSGTTSSRGRQTLASSSPRGCQSVASPSVRAHQSSLPPIGPSSTRGTFARKRDKGNH